MLPISWKHSIFSVILLDRKRRISRGRRLIRSCLKSPGMLSCVFASLVVDGDGRCEFPLSCIWEELGKGLGDMSGSEKVGVAGVRIAFCVRWPAVNHGIS